MTDATLSTGARVAPAERAGRPGWLAALPGILFAITYLAGIFVGPQAPDTNASGKVWLDFIASRNNQIMLLVGGFLWVISGVLLMVFLTRLYQRVYGEATGRDPLPLVAAAAAGALVAAGGVLNAALPGALIFGQMPVPDHADLVQMMLSIGFPVAMVAGMFALALSVGLITTRAQRTGYFGRALSIFSYVAVAAAIAAFMFFPGAIVLIWAIVVSVVLARRPAVAQSS